jgi:hypothetical protein
LGVFSIQRLQGKSAFTHLKKVKPYIEKTFSFFFFSLPCFSACYMFCPLFSFLITRASPSFSLVLAQTHLPSTTTAIVVSAPEFVSHAYPNLVGLCSNSRSNPVRRHNRAARHYSVHEPPLQVGSAVPPQDTVLPSSDAPTTGED